MRLLIDAHDVVVLTPSTPLVYPQVVSRRFASCFRRFCRSFLKERSRVKTTAAFALLVLALPGLAGRVEVDVGVKARAEPDRVADVGGLDGGAVRRMLFTGREIEKGERGLVLLSG
jgi:hypothetical protein